MTTTTEQPPFDIATLRCAAGTDVGMRREENQDSFGVIRHEAFQAFFVADGMGGVKGGAIASRLAISTLQESLPALGGGMSPETLSEVVSLINSKIFEQGSAQPSLAGMGTTLVGLVFTSMGLIGFNVGDSRAYRIRGESIQQLSEDHTLVSELVKSGALSSSEAGQHPVSHMLTRSLGPLNDVLIECRVEPEGPQEGDVYVLCSDGLYNFVKDSEIADVVRQNPLDDANQILINLANRRGGTDNITVIVISVGDLGGRGRGSEYRKARNSTARDLAAMRTYVSSPQSSAAGIEKERGDGDGGSLVVDDQQSVTPPKVEEPRNIHAEREILKERNRRFQPQNQGLPVSLMVFGAVLFGLVAGDIARRWGTLPDLARLFPRIVSSSQDQPHGSVTNLDEVSRELSLSRSPGAPHEGLPDIARRIRDSQLPENGARSPGGARQDLLMFNRKVLENMAAKIEAHLSVLKSENGQSDEGALQRATSQAEAYQRELSEIEMQIDATSRKLSLWFGRKKRFEAENQDTLTGGGDIERVGAISEDVKRKVAELTEASYRLQAKQDEFELYPANESLRQEVERLRKMRAQLAGELRGEINKAIDGVLAETYKQLEALKTRRDIVANQLSSAQEEVDFLKMALDRDPAVRENSRKKFQAELDDIRLAIKEILADE